MDALPTDRLLGIAGIWEPRFEAKLTLRGHEWAWEVD